MPEVTVARVVPKWRELIRPFDILLSGRAQLLQEIQAQVMRSYLLTNKELEGRAD
jgi:hypothetical protein